MGTQSLDCLVLDIIAISETWLSISDNIAEFQLEGYKLANMNRENRRGGGVCFYISNTLSFKEIPRLSFAKEDNFECLTIEVDRTNSKNMIVTCVYRTPGSSMDKFNDEFKKLLTEYNNQKHIYICGDFNIDLLKYETYLGAKDCKYYVKFWSLSIN